MGEMASQMEDQAYLIKKLKGKIQRTQKLALSLSYRVKKAAAKKAPVVKPSLSSTNCAMRSAERT